MVCSFQAMHLIQFHFSENLVATYWKLDFYFSIRFQCLQILVSNQLVVYLISCHAWPHFLIVLLHYWKSRLTFLNLIICLDLFLRNYYRATTLGSSKESISEIFISCSNSSSLSGLVHLPFDIAKRQKHSHQKDTY